MFLRLGKLLCVIFLLCAVSAANGAPTVKNSEKNVAGSAVLPGSNACIPIVPEAAQITEYSDSHLAAAAAEFLKPPVAFGNAAASAPIDAKTLPAVPASLFMVLTGFLCVSLVKDRRVWLAALAGVLWLGQAGVQAVPKMALCLSHRIHTEQLDTELTSPYYLVNSNRLRSDIEGTQYIGLLHHLAGIPDNTMSFLFSRESSQTEDEFRAPQFAIMGLSSHLIPATNCLAAKVEQIIYFSPAFIFDNLARGPPLLA